VRELPGSEAPPHRLLSLWFLPREKGFGPDKKGGKEAKESQSESGTELIMASRTRTKFGTGLLINYIHFVH
jgi:hypothetical protein